MRTVILPSTRDAETRTTFSSGPGAPIFETQGAHTRIYRAPVRAIASVKVGDRVLFSSYAGTQIKEGGTEYLILEASEILAVVDDAPFANQGDPATASYNWVNTDPGSTGSWSG